MDKNKTAIDFMVEHKYEEAAKLFNEIIEDNPDDSLGYINFGNLLLQMEEYERAHNFFEKAIGLDETAATAYYGLGNLYFEQAVFPKAQENFLKAIESGLEVGDVYYLLGMSLVNQEHTTLAIPYLLRSTELDQTDDEKLFQYGLALAQNNYIPDAKKVFDNVLAINSKHSDAHYNLAIIALYNSQTTKAFEHFDMALEIQPDHVLAANGKAKVEELLNNNES